MFKPEEQVVKSHLDQHGLIKSLPEAYNPPNTIEQYQSLYKPVATDKAFDVPKNESNDVSLLQQENELQFSDYKSSGNQTSDDISEYQFDKKADTNLNDYDADDILKEKENGDVPTNKRDVDDYEFHYDPKLDTLSFFRRLGMAQLDGSLDYGLIAKYCKYHPKEECHQVSQGILKTFNVNLLIHSANSQPRPVGIIVFAHIVRPSVRPLFKSSKTKQQKTIFATGVSVGLGLAIDDTSLVYFYFVTSLCGRELKVYVKMK